jgi:pyruvate dehydrogenase E1 component
MAAFRKMMNVREGHEWDPFEGLTADPNELRGFIKRANFAGRGSRRLESAAVPVPDRLNTDFPAETSTQFGFGKILFDLAAGDSALAQRIVTTSPDVTVSTNLGGWVNRRGIFDRRDTKDVFRDEKVVSAQKWAMDRDGQHIELGIAENNLFLMLAALGLAGPLFGARLLPIGTLYDPFIQRGLDALNYACYQDARFMLVATPSGVSLAPEGGAHQSISTPLIGMGQDKLTYFEPTYVDELSAIMEWGFGHMQAEDGGSVYLRLSTRPLAQPQRTLDAAAKADIIAGGYWLAAPAQGAELAVVACGVVTPEVIEAHRQMLEDVPGAGLLVVTSPDRLYAEWRRAGRAGSQIDRLLAPLAPGAALVSVIDGHPAALSWLGGVRGQRIRSLGIDHFGQSGDIPDLYRAYGLDADAILDAAAGALLG